jgi:hypothetical protein
MVRNIFIPLSAVLISATLLFSQNDNRDKSPFPGKEGGKHKNTLALWDLEFSFNVTNATGAAGNAGAEFDGTYFYTTRWASNLIHKFDMSGNLVETFSIPGVTGLRDLAFDGTYMYGGAAGNTIYQMDFNTKTLIGTISSPVLVRFIAYDEYNDAFWCGTWDSDPTLVSRTGQNFGSFSTGLTAQYGAAYDWINAGGPYLWIFDQGTGTCPGSLIIYQFDIASGTPTGVQHDACVDLTNGIAGGLFSTIDFIAGQFNIGGLMQSNSGLDDTFFLYGLNLCSVAPPSNPSPPDGAQNILVNLSQLSWSNSPGEIISELYFGTNPDSLIIVQGGGTDSTWNITSNYLPLQYFTTYYWMVINYVTGCYPTFADWSFTTEEGIPVEIISFTSDVINGKIVLNWGTATETNNKGFEIQRAVRKESYEGIEGRRPDWKKIAFVEGNGTTTLPRYYSFMDLNSASGSYLFRLKQIDYDGTFRYSNMIEAEITAPDKFSLEQNYPDPFNPSTTICYSIPGQTKVIIKIYNMLGKEVETLLEEEKSAGTYSVTWKPSDLAGGIYFYQLSAGSFIKTKKMVYVK